jgi:hypothetical protein
MAAQEGCSIPEHIFLVPLVPKNYDDDRASKLLTLGTPTARISFSISAPMA